MHREGDSAPRPIRRILVAVRPSDGPSAELERAVELAARVGATIDVLYVLAPVVADLPEARRRAMAWLERLIIPYWSKRVPLYARIATGHPGDVIPALARSWESDVVFIESDLVP